MTGLKSITAQNARPLPVLLLADVSGSMADGGKIQAMNNAIREMLESFRDEDDLRAEIHVAVLAFGANEARWQVPLGPATEATWADMQARGNTPMAAAFEAALAVLQDRAAIPSRAYRPTLVLVSDGEPTDEKGYSSDNWKTPLQTLLANDRGSKAERLALAIGEDANMAVLEAFVGDPKRVMRAEKGEARQIRRFFNYVTMSVTARSRSANPNASPSLPTDEEEWEP